MSVLDELRDKIQKAIDRCPQNPDNFERGVEAGLNNARLYVEAERDALRDGLDDLRREVLTQLPTYSPTTKKLINRVFARRALRGGKVKYRTIVADPPWEYPEGFTGGHCTLAGKRTPVVVAPCPYPTMTLAEIAAIPMDSLADRDCRMFLWTTNRYLPASFDVLTAWRFDYRQTLVWHKTDVNLPAHVAPNSAEYCIVAVRGRPERLGTMPSSVIATTRLGGSSAGVKGHSQKRECWLDYFEQVSPGPYLEMFARRNRIGWDTWGNECRNDVEMSA